MTGYPLGIAGTGRHEFVDSIVDTKPWPMLTGPLGSVLLTEDREGTHEPKYRASYHSACHTALLGDLDRILGLFSTLRKSVGGPAARSALSPKTARHATRNDP